jgi:crossover junction endodeoxyribonuclease RuvC
MTEYFLGLDLSLTSPGFALISLTDGNPKLLSTYSLKTSSKEFDGDRLRKILNELKWYIDNHEETEGLLDGIMKEKGFTRFATETQKLYKVHGVVELLLAGREVEEIAPTSVKKMITGNGKATKQEVQDKVCEMLGVKKSVFKNDDESDAAAVILSVLKKRGKIC